MKEDLVICRFGDLALVLAACVVGVGAAQQRWHPHEGGLLKYRVQIRFGL